MDDKSGASVALLMLDIASAKQQLQQLQQAYTAANEEHKRTQGQLKDLKQELDVNPLYTLHSSKDPAAGSRATAQQLQALHTENLQLKALLKQEIEARQQLESQNAALLKLLSSYGPQDSLQALANHPQDVSQADTAVLSAAAATQTPAAAAAAARQQAAGTKLGQGSLHSVLPVHHSGSYTATDNSTTQGQGWNTAAANKQPSSSSTDQTGAAAAVANFNSSPTLCVPSAYFPQQQQQPIQASSGNGAAFAGQVSGSQAMQQQTSRHTPLAAAATWHRALQQGSHSQSMRDSTQQPQHAQKQVFAHQQQQQQHGPSPSNVWDHANDVADTYAATHGSMSASLNSSSANSQTTELLDSEDLEELACLCDGLMSQQQPGQQSPCTPPAATARATAAAAAALSGPVGSSSSTGGIGSNIAPHQHHSQHQTHLPDIALLAAQLQQLQQQVAAAGGMGASLHQSASSNAAASQAAACTTAATAASCGGRKHGSSTNATSTSSGAYYGSQRNNSNNSSMRSSGSTQTDGQSNADTVVMMDLQQQLARRMQEVKQRLSNICNGMLEEAMGSTGSAAAAPPPPAATAPDGLGHIPFEVQGLGSMPSQQHQQDQQQWQPPARQQQPAAAAAAPGLVPLSKSAPATGLFNSSTARSSSSVSIKAHFGSLDSKPVGASAVEGVADRARASTAAGDAEPRGRAGHPAAFVVHSDPDAATAARDAEPRGSRVAACRQRVAQGLWPGSQQASAAEIKPTTAARADTPPAAAAAAAGVGVGTDGGAVCGAGGCARDGEDAGASSDSSWATLDEDEQHHNQQQRRGRWSRQQQQQKQEQHWHSRCNAENQGHGRSTQGCAGGVGRCRRRSSSDGSGSGDGPESPLLRQHSHGGGIFSAASWQQQQEQRPMHTGVTGSLEGVLFGMLPRRVAAEVAQTASPLKGTPTGGCWPPSSPATPLKPHNV